MSKAERVAVGDYWISMIKKEDALRSSWFRKNEARLNEIANKDPTRTVPKSAVEGLKQDRVSAFRNMRRQPRIKVPDVVPEFDGALQDVMKPIDPSVRKLLYTGTNKDGRTNYLSKRVKELPEDRFYFPECSSWEYGWHLFHETRNIPKTGFGRQQIIKDSFYRRCGVHRDPDWYNEPAHINPTFCNTCH